jgi:hypothetical protein
MATCTTRYTAIIRLRTARDVLATHPWPPVLSNGHSLTPIGRHLGPKWTLRHFQCLMTAGVAGPDTDLAGCHRLAIP